MNKTKIAFGTDGWRAVMAREFTFDNVSLVAQAIADHVQKTGKAAQGVFIGYDARFLSEQFTLLIADILGANDIPVFVPDRDTPTPVVAFTVGERNLAGAVMLSASHNPPEYHGIKFIPDYCHPALPDVTDWITARIAEIQNDPGRVQRGGPAPTTIDPRPAYVAHVEKLIDFDTIRAAKLTVGVDPLHATGRGYLADLLRDAGGCNVFEINNVRNPLFGGSLPDPNAKNLAELGRLVKERGAHLGLGMDGDADRFGVVDSTGAYLNSNQVITLALRHWASTRGADGPVVRTVPTSGMIDALAKTLGIEVIETPVGFKWVGEQMRTKGAVLGGEESGGFSVKGHIPEKDGIVADLVITEMVAKTGKSPLENLREIEAIIGPFLTTRVDIRLSETSKQNLMNRLKTETPETLAGQPVVSVSRIDGVKMIRDDASWLLIRPSGTEPLIRCYIEARSEEGMNELKRAVHDLIPDGEDVTH